MTDLDLDEHGRADPPLAADETTTLLWKRSEESGVLGTFVPDKWLTGGG